MPGHPFIGLEGERGGRVSESNERRRWCAIMVMEAAVSEGDQSGWWWGVTRGRGCSGHYGSRSGAGRRRAHTRGGGSGGRLREDDDRAGLACQRGTERGEGGAR
jgi:hypothetical protein